MRKVCKNCKATYIEGDKYCRFCGARLGEPLLLGEIHYINDSFACVYGPPPMKRTHTCKKCEHSWETQMMVDKQRHCPECGGKAPVVEEKDPLDEVREAIIKKRNSYIKASEKNNHSAGIFSKWKRK